jgi:CheY-like chemotaxis protein
MSVDSKPRVLCVDDEPDILEGMRDNLRRSFEVTTAVGPTEGLEALATKGPFAVVVSDMRMPVMNGAAFLAEVHREAPDTVRMLLTGQTDLESAIAAVNQGQIFRFLTKPCPQDALLQALVAGVRQHRLLTAERQLLEETVRGSIKALTDILALVDAEAFGRASRLKRLAGELAETSGYAQVWEVETAALLSQIGCSTLPPETASRYYQGEQLTAAEEALIERLPVVAERLIREIPRLESICAILTDVNRPFSATPTPGARILRIVQDYDILETQGTATDLALATLRGRNGTYDPALLASFSQLQGDTRADRVIELPLAEVDLGMRFATDVRSSAGALLIARGHEVTHALLERIRHLPSDVTRLPVRVIVSGDDPDDDLI